MTDAEPDDAQLAEWEAAANERYKSLRTHIFVELGHVCSFPHISKAADTAAEAVRRELTQVFVAYLAACDQRDRLVARVDELEAVQARTVAGPVADTLPEDEARIAAWYAATYFKCASCDTPESIKPLTFRLPNGGGDLCADCAKPVIKSTRAIEAAIARKKAREEGSLRP